MASVFFTLFALLGGCAMFVAATGLLGTALALRAGAMGFPEGVTGAVMGAYFLGFVVGTYICPSIVSRVGHIRAFSVFAAVAAAAVLLHAMISDAFSWAALRFVTGGCVVGLYMVVESWLNEKATNQSRGRIFSLYQIISLSSLGLGQWFLLGGSMSFTTPFLICGALFALGLVPIALTKVPEPSSIPPAALDVSALWATSPLGVLGTFMTALANGVFFALGPLFAQSAGMNIQMIALFMSLVIFGGVALQWPIGHLSDKFDRRAMILCTSAMAAVSAGFAAFAIDRAIWLFFAAVFLYGGFTFSLYPLCIAHSNDRLPPSELVRTAAGLLLIYGIGASIGPLVMGLMMSYYGQGILFVFLTATHAALGVSVLYRMGARSAPPMEAQAPFVMLTQTSQSALVMMPEATGEPEERS